MIQASDRDARYPTFEALKKALENALPPSGSGSQLTILERRENPAASTFASEVVQCSTVNGPLVVFCKYEGAADDESFHPRGTLDYEAEVYRNVLSHCHSTVPRLYGKHVTAETPSTFLFIEYVDDSLMVHETPDTRGLVSAAKWLGQFHRWNDQYFRDNRPAFLTVYDAEYFAGMLARAVQFDRGRHEWLVDFCSRIRGALTNILTSDSLIIHGEYFPKNILLRDGLIYPVDWQSSAVGTGEVDLASLIEGWPAQIAEKCVSAYKTARWNTPPESFDDRLTAARIYWCLRWLSYRQDWTHERESEIQYERLRQLADTSHLI